MAAVTICSDFGAPPNKIWHVSTVSPSISHEVITLAQKQHVISYIPVGGNAVTW